MVFREQIGLPFNHIITQVGTRFATFRFMFIISIISVIIIDILLIIIIVVTAIIILIIAICITVNITNIDIINITTFIIVCKAQPYGIDVVGA